MGGARREGAEQKQPANPSSGGRHVVRSTHVARGPCAQLVRGEGATPRSGGLHQPRVLPHCQLPASL